MHPKTTMHKNKEMCIIFSKNVQEKQFITVKSKVVLRNKK